LTERKRFFEISRSSLVEADTQLEICKSLNYISESSFPVLDEHINKLFAKLSNFILKAK